MGIGDWGLGIGDWGLGPIPNPQSPIPNPQSPFLLFLNLKLFKNNFLSKKILIFNFNYLNKNKTMSENQTEGKRGKKISSTEMKDDDFFKQKADLKIILIGDSAVGKSK